MEFYELDVVAEDVKVVGTQHYADACRRFVDAAFIAQDAGTLTDEIGIRLKRDPKNAHDPYAIKVFGKWVDDDGSKKSAHIGFVGRSLAFRIGQDYDDDWKLFAQLAAISEDTEGGFEIHIHISVKDPY